MGRYTVAVGAGATGLVCHACCVVLKIIDGTYHSHADQVHCVASKEQHVTTSKLTFPKLRSRRLHNNIAEVYTCNHAYSHATLNHTCLYIEKCMHHNDGGTERSETKPSERWYRMRRQHREAAVVEDVSVEHADL